MSFIPCPHVCEPEKPPYKSQSKSKGLRTKSVDVQRQERRDVPPYTDGKFVLLLHFCAIEPSVDWMMSNCNREGYLTQSTDSNANLFRNTVTDTPRNNILPAIRVSLSAVKLAHTINPARCLWSVSRWRSAGPVPVQRYAWSVTMASGKTQTRRQLTRCTRTEYTAAKSEKRVQSTSPRQLRSITQKKSFLGSSNDSIASKLS